MPEIIVTVHTPNGSLSQSVKVEDEKEAEKLLKGEEFADLGKQLAKAVIA